MEAHMKQLSVASDSEAELSAPQVEIIRGSRGKIVRPLALALGSALLLLVVGLSAGLSRPWKPSPSFGFSHARVEESIEAASSCPASTEYYKRTDECKSGQEKLLASCSSRRDWNCVLSANDFYNNCRSHAYECYQNIRNDICNSGKNTEISEVKYCGPIVVEHTCRYRASQEKDSRISSCNQHYEERISKCPENKKTLICHKWATHLSNECVRAAGDCQTAAVKNAVCKAKTPLKDLKECAAYEEPEVVPLQPGAAVTLASGKRYKLLSANGCQWGGRFCLKPLSLLARYRWLPKELRIMKHDEHATALRLEATGKPNEFFVSNGHGSCENGGPTCYPLSLSTQACPEASWNKEYKDCVKAEVKKGGEKTPFVFTPVPGFPDQFTIKTSKTCPGGEQCDWQLATNEENCWRKSPAVVVEKLSFDYAWKIVPVE